MNTNLNTYNAHKLIAIANNIPQIFVERKKAIFKKIKKPKWPIRLN